MSHNNSDDASAAHATQKAKLSVEIDKQEKSISIWQVTAHGNPLEALRMLLQEMLAHGILLMDYLIEFTPYRGAANIVIYSDGGIDLTPKDSAMGRALYYTAYQRSDRPMERVADENLGLETFEF